MGFQSSSPVVRHSVHSVTDRGVRLLSETPVSDCCFFHLRISVIKKVQNFLSKFQNRRFVLSASSQHRLKRTPLGLLWANLCSKFKLFNTTLNKLI
eukprot:sb/3479131/